MVNGLDLLRAEAARHPTRRATSRIDRVDTRTISFRCRDMEVQIGDALELVTRANPAILAEVIAVDAGAATALVDGGANGLSVGDPVILMGARAIAPDDRWLGRIVDADGHAIDGRPLLNGDIDRPLLAAPAPAPDRRGLGPRAATGLALFDTLLPLARGQRIGLFAGSGIGKSSLLAQLARGLEADVVVVALVGERGREVQEFVSRALGARGRGRSIVFAATSDRPPQERRRCLWSAMAAAEHFRDRGRHVLLLCDSLTRFAEAHREIAIASGEPATLRGYPPSTVPLITALCERAGPGTARGGDITAVFSVLVAGSDMEEPLADIVRGVLDGHVVLDRAIAERGRFPAVDVLRSVSRSLPDAASEVENSLILTARSLLGAYENAEMMVQAGLYTPGSSAEIDAAIRVWPELDRFASRASPGGVAESFAMLEASLSHAAEGEANRT